MTQKLNHVLAVERATKSKAHSELTKLHHTTTRPVYFTGFSKTYKPLEEDGEEFPPESQRVQLDANDVLKQVRTTLSDLFDLTATKDSANQSAKADVVVDGDLVISDVPATTLLFLEKQLTDLRTFVDKLPTLDPSFEWNYDEAVSLWKTPEVKTTKTRKVAKPIVLYPATEQHPAQTQLTQEDQTVGHWVKVHQSGALPESKKKDIITKIEKLQKAVKYARETANLQEAPDKKISDAVFRFLF
jgi:hypothetical protein